MANVAPSLSDPTRAKLLEAAGEVFAEHGFHAATVREICSRAGANVAAVNYHFGDKVELYAQVLRDAVCNVHDRPLWEALSREEPNDALRRAIRHMLGRLCSPARTNLTMRLMLHEMTQPTPGLARVVDEVIAPNYRMLRRIIGNLIDTDPDDDKTRLCAHSIIGQILHYAQSRPVISRLWPKLELNDETLDKLAEHIGDFSLAYLNANRRHQAKRR
jgi:AcrR family transcriptional regulator